VRIFIWARSQFTDDHREAVYMSAQPVFIRHARWQSFVNKESMQSIDKALLYLYNGEVSIYVLASLSVEQE